MTDRKIYCEVLEGVTFAERCLYELSKVIEGNKTCESCIFRELQRLRKGIVIESRPCKKNKDRRKKRAVGGELKTIKGSSDMDDINERKEREDLKKSFDTSDIREELEKSVQGARESLDKESEALRQSLDDKGFSEELERSTQGLREMLVLNIQDLARILGKAKRTVQDLAKRGKIPGGRKIGPHWAFDKEEIDRWIEGGGSIGAAVVPEDLKTEVEPIGESSQESGALPPDQRREGPGDNVF